MSLLRRFCGSEFQTVGPETRKLREPYCPQEPQAAAETGPLSVGGHRHTGRHGENIGGPNCGVWAMADRDLGILPKLL